MTKKLKSSSATPIPHRDGQLKHGGDRYPNQIRDLSERDPLVVLPDGDHAPENGCPDDENIHSCQRQVAQSELDRCEDQVRCEIDRKWQRDQPADFAAKRLYEHKPKTDQDHRVENLPDHPDGRRLRRPTGLGQ